MQAWPSSVTAPWNEKSGEAARPSDGEGSGSGSGAAAPPAFATDQTAAHSFQLPEAVLH